MAFKMKNPSMAKLTKAAGDNRVAMKMKMEEKAAAAKMKRESAMKLEKESMAKLMEKSAMKMKSPMKADIPEVTITDKKKPEDMKAFSHYTYNGKKVDVVENDGVKFIKLGNQLAPLNRELKKGNLKYIDTGGNDISYRYKTEESRARQSRVDQYYSDKEREGGSAAKMKKSPIKADIPEVTVKPDVKVQPKSESNNAKRKAVRDEYNRLKKLGTDKALRKARAMEVENRHGFFTTIESQRQGGTATKMKKSATKFNAELKAASKAGKLSGKFKEAVDASPAKLMQKESDRIKDNKLSKLKSELDKVNDQINDVMKTKDVSTLMNEKAKKVAERRGLSRTEIMKTYLSPLQDKKDSLRNEISKIK